MKATKHKILEIHSSTRPVLIDETKPDRRYSVGYRKTGDKIAKIAVDTTLILSLDPYVRFGQICLVSGFGRMRVTDIQKTGEIRCRNTDMQLQESYSISFKVDDYIDVLPLGFIVGGGSTT